MKQLNLTVWVVALLLLLLLAAVAKGDGSDAAAGIFLVGAALAAVQICISFSAFANP